MMRDIWKRSGKVLLLALLALGTASAAWGADGMAERYRMQRYYECCYGPSYYGRNGYVRRMNWWRNAYCDGKKAGAYCGFFPDVMEHGPNCMELGCDCHDENPDCKAHHRHCCCCRCCCCTTCLVPGAKPPSKFLDICLYHVVFPMSPWYSNPRDGIVYPAYGSKSPICVPARD